MNQIGKKVENVSSLRGRTNTQPSRVLKPTRARAIVMAREDEIEDDVEVRSFLSNDSFFDDNLAHLLNKNLSISL